jgi:hypothetical protein
MKLFSVFESESDFIQVNLRKVEIGVILNISIVFIVRFDQENILRDYLINKEIIIKKFNCTGQYRKNA